MGSSDAYDPAVAFDDYAGGRAPGQIELPSWSSGGSPEESPEAPSPVLGAADAVRSLLSTVRRRRRKLPPLLLVGADDDPTYRTFEVEGRTYTIIGTEPTVQLSDTPIFDALRRKFASTAPEPRYVRVDDSKSYGDFRSARRDPYVKSLERRVAELELAVVQHTVDNHGGGRVARLEQAFARLANQARCGGTPIALPLDQCARGAIECWLDGGEILCTVRVPGSDGRARMITSGTPVEKYVDEVVGAAAQSGTDPELFVSVAPMVVQVLGASALIQRLCAAANGLMRQSKGKKYVGVLSSASDPDTAAAMTVLQRCQIRDPRALNEAFRVYKRDPELIGHAIECLNRGQLAKAKAFGRVS